MTKFEKIMEILNELSEICPELENIMTDNKDDPGFILIGDRESFDGFVEMLSRQGIEGDYVAADSEELFDEMLEEAWAKKLIGYDGDDEGSGNLQ